MPTLQDLSSIFDSGNYGLLDRGLQAQTTAQNKAQADLASVLQKTQQDASMHPLDMEYKQASTGNLNAQSRNSNALAAQHEDALALLKNVPMQQRVDDWMSTSLKNKSSADLESLKSHMGAAAQIAAGAISNGGQLPLGMQTTYAKSHPDLLEYLKLPNGAQTLANMVTKYESLQGDRLKSDSAHNISAGASKYGADQAYNRAIDVAELRADLDKQKAALKAQYDNNPIHRITALITARQAAAEKNDTAQVALIDREIAAQTPVAALAARAFAPVGGVDLATQTQGGVATNPAPSLVPNGGTPQVVQLPKEAMSKLQEGAQTTFGNGQVWTLQNGQPKRVK